MNDPAYEQFLTSILSTLGKNGYPEKRVALPLDRMYEVAYEKQLNFNKALEALKERGVDHYKTTEKVIFFTTEDPLRQAQEAMKSMTPEQLAEVQKMYEQMSPDQRDDLMKKAKDMGLL